MQKFTYTRFIKLAALFILLVFAVQIGLAPLHKVNEWEGLLQGDSTFSIRYDSSYFTPQLVFSTRERAYKEALLKASEKDSISLIVNLRDSSIHLGIKGVIIHTTIIKSMEMDPLLVKMPGNIYVKILGQPVRIISEKATIVKEPIVVREAPKNSMEASLNAYKPDTLIQNPAFLKLDLNYGIDLVFDQEENLTFHDAWVGYRFRAGNWIEKVQDRLINFITLRKQVYDPKISIKMPVDDLRAIYRALPEKAYVVLYY